jgi:hypothetical protein
LSYFDIYLKSNSGNVTDGMTLTTETGDQNFIVLFNVVQATITGNECGDFLSVLDELDTDAFTDGRVRLLSFDSTGDEIKVLDMVLKLLTLSQFQSGAEEPQTTTHSIIL